MNSLEASAEINTGSSESVDTNYPRMAILAPDGAQGGKLKVGINNELDEAALRSVYVGLNEEGLALSIKNLRSRLQRAGLDRVDI